MSESTATRDRTAGLYGEAAGAFNKMWSEFASKMVANGFTMPGDNSDGEMAKQMRNTFFAAWSEACERYMRSQEFQQMMRESMGAAIELRKQMNEQLGEFHSAMQSASRQDIDRIMHSVDILEQRFTQSYEQIVDCLEAVTARLDALEKGSRGAAKPAAKAPVKKLAKKAPGKSSRATKKRSKKKAR